MFWKKKPEVTPVKENEKKTNACDEMECIRMRIDRERDYEEAVRKAYAVKSEIERLYSDLRQKQFEKCTEEEVAYTIVLQNGIRYLANVYPATDDKWFSFNEYVFNKYEVRASDFYGGICKEYYIKNPEQITINTDHIVSIKPTGILIASEKIPEVGKEILNLRYKL